MHKNPWPMSACQYVLFMFPGYLSSVGQALHFQSSAPRTSAEDSAPSSPCVSSPSQPVDCFFISSPPEGAQAGSVFVLSVGRRKGKGMRVKYKERREKAMNRGRKKRRERQGRATERYGRKRGRTMKYRERQD